MAESIGRQPIRQGGAALPLALALLALALALTLPLTRHDPDGAQLALGEAAGGGDPSP